MSRTIALLFLAGCIVGCGGGGGKGGSASPNLPNPTLAEANINAQRGGDVAVTNTSSALFGTQIKIPPGALANDTRIAISAAQVQQLPTPTRPTSIGPSGTTFAVPASVELTYDPGLIQPGDDPENLIVMVQDVNGNTEVYVEPIINSSLRLATITTTHLSLFEVLFPWEYKLFRQQQRLIDGRQERYEMGVSIFNLLTGGLLVKEYHPIIANGPANITATFGKGTATDFFTTDTGNILFLHGLFSTPANFQFDDQGLPNDNDLLAFLKTKQNVKNILHYQYQSGWPIAFNAKVLSDLITKNASPKCRFVIVAHSMGGLVARHAIEQHGLGQYVEKLITLGTPHEGAPKYKLSKLLTTGASLLSAVTVPGIEDLLVGSTFLTNLNSGYPGKKPASLLYYAFAGQENANAFDDAVVTITSATAASLNLPSSQKRVIPNTDHNALHANARNNGVGVLVNAIIENRLNNAPTANAGVDRAITLGPQVTLDGSGSSDADPGEKLFYTWTQTGGPTTPIANATGAVANVTPTQVGTYTFELTVSDTAATSTDTVTIIVNPIIYRATIILTDDTYIDPLSPDTNYGGAYELYAGVPPNSIDDRSSYFQFELQSAIPPGATIRSATLHIPTAQVLSGGSNATVSARRINNGWSENIITSTNESTYIYAYYGQQVLSTTTWTADFTGDLQALVNAGLPIGTKISFFLSSNDYIKVGSKEGGSPTELTIEWQ